MTPIRCRRNADQNDAKGVAIVAHRGYQMVPDTPSRPWFIFRSPLCVPKLLQAGRSSTDVLFMNGFRRGVFS